MKVGIDIGGSHIAVGVVNNNGEIVEKIEKSWSDIEKRDMEKSIENYITEQILEFSKVYKIEEIGIGSPGTVSKTNIIKADNLGLKNYPIVDVLNKKIKIPVKIRNDAKCAALAEDMYGCLKRYRRTLFLTLGTGVGGAVIIDHQLLDTGDKPGCEVGHMIIQKDGISCKCGKKGCWQQYSSMKALKENFSKELGYSETIHGRDLLDIIKNIKEGQKDYEKIEKILKEYIENLAIGISNLVNIFEPEAIGIGGSFVYFEELLLPRLKKELNNNLLFNPRENLQVEIAMLGNDAGIIGAVL